MPCCLICDTPSHTHTHTSHTYTHAHTPQTHTNAGLGNTVNEIDVSKASVFSKTVFSMVIPEVEEVMKKDEKRNSVVLFGIEVIE